MKIDRAVNIQIELRTRVNDLFSFARVCSLTHADILERYTRLYDKYPKLPRHVREYTNGYFHALLDNLYRTDLFHAYKWNGELYKDWDSSPEELKAHCRSTPSDQLTTHGHYWTHSQKPFFTR